MWYSVKDSKGEFFVNDFLEGGYFNDIQKTMCDGKKPKKCNDLAEKNLLWLSYFTVYENDQFEDLSSVNDAIKALEEGKKLYAGGIYYSNNLKDLGHSYWRSPVGRGWDPNFIDTDAKVVKIIKTKRRLKLVLECCKESYIYSKRETHTFSVVQAHF